MSIRLGYVYNGLPANEFKDEFELWAKAEYPDVWARLVKKGRKTNLEGFQRINITRNMEA